MLALTALRWPNQAIVGVFVFLPVMGLVRRLLYRDLGLATR